MNRCPKQHLLLSESNLWECCRYAFYESCCDIVYQYQMCDQSRRRGNLAQQFYRLWWQLPISGIEEWIVHAPMQCNPLLLR